jgi:hypothetical protein
MKTHLLLDVIFASFSWSSIPRRRSLLDPEGEVITVRLNVGDCLPFDMA